MSDEIFADGFGDISVTGSTIRIDLVSQSATERDAGGQPALRFRQRVILPVEGFLRAHEMMQRMLEVLIQQGMVKREPAAPTASSGTGPDASRGVAPTA